MALISAAATQSGARATPTTALRQRGHLDHLDGLRALAALFVVMHHAWLEVWPVEYRRFPTGVLLSLTAWMMYGHFAVTVFIVISGFCLALPVVRSGGTMPGGVRQFLKRRAWRILPPYYAAIAFSLLLIWLLIGHLSGTHWDVSLRFGMRDVLRTLFLLQDVYATTAIDHVLWSISVEWQLYFLCPVLVLAWQRIGVARATMGAMLVSALGYTSLLFIHEPIAVLLEYLGLFALGACTAAVTFSPQTKATLSRVSFTLPAVAVMLFALVCYYSYLWGHGSILSTWQLGYLDLLIGLFAACVLIASSRSNRNVLRSVLGWRPLVAIGTFSYSIYLIHAPLLQIVWQYLVHPFRLDDARTFALLVVMSIPLIVGCSWLFYLVFERPFIKIGHATRTTDLAATHP